MTHRKIPNFLKHFCKDDKDETLVKIAMDYGYCQGVAWCSNQIGKVNKDNKEYKIQQLKGNEV